MEVGINANSPTNHRASIIQEVRKQFYDMYEFSKVQLSHVRDTTKLDRNLNS